ncbi:iron-containing alcohol dehydrogenase [Polaromonas sp. P1(28)-13]|nr:iron-containing alcohol dehydrogenase [Polaromonas sp. P1(28)-13]
MASINYMTAIEFDCGAISLLPQALQDAAIRRPMVVTDQGIIRAGILAQIRPYLPTDDQMVLYAGTPPNPTEQAVEAATEIYKEGQCDGLIAIGGGSSIDLAKAVALLATHAGPLEQYATILGGQPKIGPQAAPLIAVPTTAGTGSEVGRGTLICLRDGRKLVFASKHLLPVLAICDPDLTVGMPGVLTAGTGMDAFTHCIETFLSPKLNPTAEAIALDGAGRAWRWIERAVTHPEDRSARREMMLASIHGGLAFQKGLGAVHSLSHPLGALLTPVLHHGTVNAVILPTVLRYNRHHVGDKYAQLVHTFGLPAGTDLPNAVWELTRRLDMPANLGEMQVQATVVDRIVEGALADHSTPTNPRSLTRQDLAMLFMEALG